MVLAGRRGDERLGESAAPPRRRCGSRPSTRASPSATSRHTGRQAEVIEVKGSVELAPLVGLADGIVDLVATGRTLEENDLEVREEIVECTARLVANRVAHKLRAAEVDELTARLREATADEGRSASIGRDRGRASRERDPRLGRRRRARRWTWTPIERQVRERGDEAVLELTARFDATEGCPRRCASTRARSQRARRARRRRCARRSRSPRTTSAPSPRRSSTSSRGRRAAPGPDASRSARSRSAPPASTRPAAAPPTPRAC